MPGADALSFRAAVDDPRKVVKVVASDGKSGEQREISYTNCKVIGNGSFGIVFQARLLDDAADGDIAIKKVLQDKRFKVRRCPRLRVPFVCSVARPERVVRHPSYSPYFLAIFALTRTVSCKSCDSSVTRMSLTLGPSSTLMATR